jgi:AcrR family transcriptional regulator
MSLATKQRILSAAESLFASQGFTHTSTRMITQQAGVNLAAVNYHFGSKKNLIQAVLRNYFESVIPNLDAKIDQLEKVEQPEIIDIIRCVITPLIAMDKDKPHSASVFIQLLGRGYSDSQGHLRSFILGNYGDTIARLMSLFRRSVSDVSEQELFWRLHFALGSFVFSMASSNALVEIAQADFNQYPDTEAIIERLALFVASGIQQ